MSDVVDFHVRVRPAYLASVGEEPVDQLVATVSGQDWRVIVEDSVVLADKPDVTEASNQWLPAAATGDGDLKAPAPSGHQLDRHQRSAGRCLGMLSQPST